MESCPEGWFLGRVIFSSPSPPFSKRQVRTKKGKHNRTKR
jgi:hypothetical protein